jgi:hypothetical protein
MTNNIIIYGDQSSGVDVTKSTTINKIIADLYPLHIIGTGDHEFTTTNTPKVLCNGIDRWSFEGRLNACVGNHDNDQADDFASFNAFFNGGGDNYSKVTVGEIDFFLYNIFLKEDGGYYNSSEVSGLSVETMQATTQGQWLIAQLAASTNTWKVVVFHQNCWTSGQNAIVHHADGMRWDWYSLGVDLIFNAHQHFYERLLIDTGSGNVPIIQIGHSGALAYTGPNAPLTPITGSQIIISGNDASDNYDADCAVGFVNILSATATQLTFNTYGVNSTYDLSASKDELVLTK